MKISKLGSSGSRRRLALALASAAIFAVGVGSSSTAHAQYGRPRYYAQPGYYPPAYRSGLVAGVGIGFGGISADQCGGDCGGGLSLEGHIGGMLNPNLALEFDAWAVFHRNNDFDTTTTSGIYTGALQVWLTPILWLKGGAGLGNTERSDFFGSLGSASGFAIMGAAGVELVHSGFFALDLQGRIGHSFFSNADGGAVTNYAFMVGFNWY
ncbi:MAG TPA: hypothetical protein VFH68_20940 [Polyangia bacterium]|nr:hypothetical protein [Polyangia bacterium]